MATIYRRGGKKNKGGTYYIQYFDENGKRRTAKGCKDKEATEAYSRKLEADVLLRKKGIIDSKADRYAVEGRKTISEHLDDFKKGLLASGVTPEYAQKVFYRASKVFELVKLEYLKDASSSTIGLAIGSLRKKGKSHKTCNDYLAGVKQFFKWLREDQRIAENPADNLRGFNKEEDKRHLRRALTDDELRRLFETAEKSVPRLGFSGFERSLIYRFAVLTGLRANEIRTLKKCSFKLDGNHPTVIVEAAFSKHRKQDTIPLPPEIVQRLKDYLKDKEENDSIFNLPIAPILLLRPDIEEAGIPYQTREGFADFHALRHTYVTRLIRSNVNIKTAQTLARHSDPRLTLGVYSHIEIIDQMKALKSLPSLESDTTEGNKSKALSTGTYRTQKVSAVVGTSVGSQDTPSDKVCHYESVMNRTKLDRKVNESGRLNSDCHGMSSGAREEGKTALRGIEPLFQE